MSERKKYPPTLERVFVQERYEASLTESVQVTLDYPPSDRGGGVYLWMRSDVISGHKVKFPVFSALHSVDRAGLPRAPWRNAMRSEMVA